MEVATPSHYTSENSEEIKREVEAIYEEQNKENEKEPPEDNTKVMNTAGECSGTSNINSHQIKM